MDGPQVYWTIIGEFLGFAPRFYALMIGWYGL